MRRSSSRGTRGLGGRPGREKEASRRKRSQFQIVVGEAHARRAMRESLLLSAVANESGHVQSQEVTLAKRGRSLSAVTRVDPGQNPEEVSGKKSRSLFAATKVDLEQGLEEALGKMT